MLRLVVSQKSEGLNLTAGGSVISCKHGKIILLDPGSKLPPKGREIWFPNLLYLTAPGIKYTIFEFLQRKHQA
jgi:hypothetical protein